MALIVGHSHVKYFHQYLFDENITSLSYSGSKIEELWPHIADIAGNFKVIAIHTGANNIPRDGVHEVLQKLRCLCDNIHEANPSAHILISAIPPRAQSGFQNNRKSPQFLQTFNNIAMEVNKILDTATQTEDKISFVDFPEYTVNGQVQRHLLSKDGLHLSVEGTSYIVSTIEDRIFRTMWDLTKVTIGVSNCTCS